MLRQNGSIGKVTALGKEDSRSENRLITCEGQRWIQRNDIRMGLISPQIIQRLRCIRYQYYSFGRGETYDEQRLNSIYIPETSRGPIQRQCLAKTRGWPVRPSQVLLLEEIDSIQT